MIITMQNVDKDMARAVAKGLADMGVDVHVKNGNGQIVLAALNLTADKLDPAVVLAMDGVKSCEKSNAFFNLHWPDFLDACLFFRWGH